MNKNRLFAFFILIALLITCVGVSFASDDFDNSFIEDSSIDDDFEIDDSDLDDLAFDDSDDDSDEDYEVDDEDYLDDEDWEDYDDEDYLDDEDWEDYDDEDYLDDEDWEDYDDEDYWDDEDWEDYDDEDYLDDFDWEGYVYDDVDWFEEGNFTEGGKVYIYKTLAYKTGKAVECAYLASNSFSDEMSIPEKDYSTSAGSCSDDENNADSSVDSYTPTTKSKNSNSISKTIDLGDIKETITPINSFSTDNSKNTSEKNTLNNQTENVVQTSDDLGIFAVLALLLVSLLVII